MSRLTWRSLAIVGTFVALACSLISHFALQLAFQASCLSVVAAVAIAIFRFQPRNRSTWYGFAAAAGFFFFSYGLRLEIPSFRPQPSGNPTLADFIDALGYLSAIISVHRLGQVRDRDKDPTTVIDALILTGGVSAVIWIAILLPFAQNTHLSLSGRILGVIVGALSIWLAFGAIRLVIGPSVRNATSKLLNLSAFCGMLSEILCSAGPTAEGTSVLLFGALALTYLGSAILHPTMVEVTEPSTRGIGKMTYRRLFFMTLAAIVAPVTMLIELIVGQTGLLFHGGLIVSWVIVTSLVMFRFGGLVRARERVADVEHLLSRAAASLVSATDREATYQHALTAMAELAGKDTQNLRTAVALSTTDGWKVACAWGFGANVANGRTLDTLMMESMFSASGIPVQLNNTLALDNPKAGVCSTVVAALKSHGTIRGALLISTETPLSSSIVDAVGALASDVSLAVEAVGLAEDLHRQESERRFRSLVQHSNDLTAVLDHEGRITYISPSVETLLGYKPEELETKELSDILHPDDRHVIRELAGLLVHGKSGSKNLELRANNTSGTWKFLEVTLTDLHHDPSVAGIVMNAHDITDRKALEFDLRHKVLHDDLTGIANRVLFRDRVDHALRTRPYNHGMLTAVLFIDIDDFKTVNDGLGHDIGDELLKVIAYRLESFTRAGDTAARLGGDEFAVLLEGQFTFEDLLMTSQRLLECLNQPVEFGRREITVSASIGIALAEDGITSEVLLRNADVAMYHAKQEGKSRIKLFDEAMYISAFERLELKGDLAHALERNELVMHYQPLFSMQTREIVGFEALMRWIHPTRGFVSPVSFIPLAEETGLIVPIGAWAAQEALNQLAQWRKLYGCNVGMSVNVSPRQLDEDGIVEHIQQAINDSGVDPSWVTLELTESSGLDDSASRARLIALRELGCGIAADDFGTGFASYAALQQLPFTNVKIDRSLINGLSDSDERAHAQVRSIIDMGHALGLSITAEGIEDARQADALTAMGADKAQGYLFGKPVAATEAGEQLRPKASTTQ